MGDTHLSNKKLKSQELDRFSKHCLSTLDGFLKGRGVWKAENVRKDFTEGS